MSSPASCLHIAPPSTCSFASIMRTTLSPFSHHLCRTARRSSWNTVSGFVLRPFSWMNISCCLYTVALPTLVSIQCAYDVIKYVLCPGSSSTWYHDHLPDPVWLTPESTTNDASCSLMIVAVPPLWYLSMLYVSHLLWNATDWMFSAFSRRNDASICDTLKLPQLMHT